ncbi:MAG: FG-GAP repeat protein [Phycisphaerae bacterium]|nr:FG-GAP repeat protein [Phycisphaerae bacterium]
MNDPKGSVRSAGTLWWGLFAALMSIGVVTWVGCLPPATPGSTITAGSGIKTVNTPPTMTITQPSQGLTISQGDRFTICWTDSDPDDNAVISIFLDPDSVPNSGNELLVIAGRQEDPDGISNDCVEVDTELLNVPIAKYRIVGIIQDAAGNVVTSSPNFYVEVLAPGISPGNEPPKIKITEPTENIGVVHNDKVCVMWEGSDSDNPDITVTLSLDYDLDPTNDEDVPPIVLATGLPLNPADVDPNTVDPNTVDPNACQGFQIVIDTAGKIPPREDGLPYFIQACVTDGINPPVYSYAIGWLTVQKWAAGVVDLGETGEGLAGAIFQGFHGKAEPLDANEVGGLAGSSCAKVGDLDGDGIDEFIIAARYSNPRGRGKVGQAYMIYGRKTRFSSLNSLNSVATNIRGAQFHAGTNRKYWFSSYSDEAGGDKGLASVGGTADFDGDGLPELIFGCPDVWWYDNFDDDPLDDDDVIYEDDLPYPYSSKDPANDDYGTDRMSVVVYVSSKQEYPQNALEGQSIDLALVGQRDPATVSNDEYVIMAGALQPRGVRFRGWHPLELGATQFGETVTSIPDTDNDGLPELVFSAPDANDGRGVIHFYLGGDFAEAGNQEVKSFPWYDWLGPWDLPEGSIRKKYAFRWLMNPQSDSVYGAFPDDHLGRGKHAGDFNQDGSPDLACGAPEADRNGLTDVGVSYIAFLQLNIGDVSMLDHPRVEIVGTSAGDRLGETQDGIGDFNGDGVDDMVLGSKYLDPNGQTDAGFAAVLFGGRQYTGERTYSAAQIATPGLPGVMFIGSKPGDMAGAMVSSAGDFNGDGRQDILICAPGAEYEYQAGGKKLVRKGVCYLIFGNSSLKNKTFRLNQVGSTSLPGIVFVSPYQKGTADEAGVDTCFSIGDINGDGYDDIIIGNTTADYVNPANPSQRRVDAGEVYVVYGNSFGSNDPGRW